MVAYTIPAKSNRTAVADGRRFILLAAPRDENSRNRHARAGDRVQLRTAPTKSRAIEAFPEALCAFSGLVTFAVEGIVRVIDHSRYGGAPNPDFDMDAAAQGEAVFHMLNAAEQGAAGDRRVTADRIAAAAGFKDYDALWASIRKDDGEVIARQLIAWVL